MKIQYKILFSTILVVLFPQFVTIMLTAYTVNESHSSVVLQHIRSILEPENTDGYTDFFFKRNTGAVENANKVGIQNVYKSYLLNDDKSLHNSNLINARIGGKQLQGICVIYNELLGRCTFASATSLDNRFNEFLKYILAITLLSVILSVIGFNLIIKRLMNPLEKLAGYISSDESNEYNLTSNQNDEIGLLIRKIKEYSVRLKQYQDEKNLIEKHRAILDLSFQVAHDIRSPLAALEMAVSQLDTVPEDHRLLIRSAAQRIHDIANDLSKKKNSPAADEENGVSVQLISGLVEGLITEKRLQYRSRAGIAIEVRLDKTCYGLFARIETTTFKRILSNLINNAVEALDGAGSVTATLAAECDKIVLKVQDSGKGIPADILPRLMQQGETHGKSGGSGLGLYHARTSLERFGGNIHLASEIGKGTTITIELPKQLAPKWFVPQLSIGQVQEIIALDDDSSIHEIWKWRFSDSLKDGSISIKHFTSPDEFISWHITEKENSSSQNKLYLCDYEFLNHTKTGLDVILELGIANEAILVTSHFEESGVRNKCEKLGIRLIPKNLAGFVPIVCFDDQSQHVLQQTLKMEQISVAASTPVDAILIDDDELVHMNWKMTAKRKNKILRAYTGSAEFWCAESKLPKETPIYIDSNLSDNIKGEDVAKDLCGKGYENLFLATGYDASSFKAMPWLKGIVGKDPPWK